MEKTSFIVGGVLLFIKRHGLARILLLWIILLSSCKHLTFRTYGTGQRETDQHHELQGNTHCKNHSKVKGNKRVSSLAATRRMTAGKMKLANLPIKQSIMGCFRWKLLKVKKGGSRIARNRLRWRKMLSRSHWVKKLTIDGSIFILASKILLSEKGKTKTRCF